MDFFNDRSKRDELILARRKDVKLGDCSLEKGELFTHSFNKGCGDRSYMDCIWKVLETTPQQVLAECVMNTDKEDEAYFKSVGRTRMLDRGEYEFYKAENLYNSLVEYRASNKQAKLANNDPFVDFNKDQLLNATVKAYFN